MLEIGKIIEGRITGITNFGAFVKLPGGNIGLVHISEIAEEFVKDVNSYLKENQTVRAKIISIDENGKISLSIRKANNSEQNAKSIRPEEIDWNKPDNTEKMSFEDRLSKFFKDSDEKMSDLKKNFESKRGGGGYKKHANY